MTIKHGIALMRLSSSPHGCAVTSIEEFYVVVADGRVLAPRFGSYAEAYEHAEKFWQDAQRYDAVGAQARANVA